MLEVECWRELDSPARNSESVLPFAEGLRRVKNISCCLIIPQFAGFYLFFLNYYTVALKP